jgi:hypothetical protein
MKTARLLESLAVFLVVLKMYFTPESIVNFMISYKLLNNVNSEV